MPSPFPHLPRMEPYSLRPYQACLSLPRGASSNLVGRWYRAAAAFQEYDSQRCQRSTDQLPRDGLIASMAVQVRPHPYFQAPGENRVLQRPHSTLLLVGLSAPMSHSAE